MWRGRTGRWDRGARISGADALTPDPVPAHATRTPGARAPASRSGHERRWRPRSPGPGRCASAARRRSPACNGTSPIRPKRVSLVGAGKTVLVRQLQEELAREGKVLVAKSLSVDKERVTLQTLMTALFYDLSPEEEP